MIQGGFAGDDEPRSIFPACINHPKDGRNEKYVGATPVRCTPEYPIKRGIIENWDDMESIWRHLFETELKIDPSDFPVLLTETLFNPRANREKSTEIMFETFDIPSFFLAKQPVMSLYGSGRISGMVLESGAEVSLVAPIFEGVCLSNAANRIEFGGDRLTDYMVELLTKRGYSFTTPDREMVRDIKEKIAYVTLDLDMAMANKTSNDWRAYELPDQKVIEIQTERFQCPEALFRPSLIGMANTPGFHKAINNAINKCDTQIQDDLFGNVVLGSGNTMFPGIADRLQKELCALIRPTTRLKVVAAPERKSSAWIGGSILGSLSMFGRMPITKAEYAENGPKFVHKKCF